jgi:hypothetical protein
MEPRISCDYGRCQLGEHIFKLSSAGFPPVRLVPIPLVKIGNYHRGSDRFSIVAGDVQHLVENFQKPEYNQVSVNYETVNEWPSTDQKTTLTEAGWLKKISEQPNTDGALWGWAELTDGARRLMATQGYKWLFPVLRWDLRDPLTFGLQGLTLVSLTMAKKPPFLGIPAS